MGSRRKMDTDRAVDADAVHDRPVGGSVSIADIFIHRVVPFDGWRVWLQTSIRVTCLKRHAFGYII